MDNLMERYVYEVARRLPEKEREDVRRELRSNIEDMLPDAPTRADLEAVLVRLGNPALLAEQYRRKPRYLISPAMFDAYVSALKWVLPLVGVLCAVFGVVHGLTESLEEATDAAGFIARAIANGIAFGVDGAVQALMWTTIGFAIADHTGDKTKDEWRVEDLPKAVPAGKSAIPLSDTIAELAVTVILSAVFIIVCLGRTPVSFAWKAWDIRIVSMFDGEFMILCVPVIAMLAVLGVAQACLKIVFRRWNTPVCVSSVLCDIAGFAATLYILTRPRIFSDEFIAFTHARQADFGPANLLRFAETGFANPVFVAIAVVVGALTLVGCVRAVVKTVRARA